MSICCHRGRHRCDTGIHACLQPTRGLLCLKVDLNFCVRPSGARLRPQRLAKDCCCRYAHYLVHLLTTVAWYITWSSIVVGLHIHTNAARRPRRPMQTVLLCKRPPTASNNNMYRGRSGSSEVPLNPLTRWDVSSTPANGIFLTKKLKNKSKNAQRVEND